MTHAPSPDTRDAQAVRDGTSLMAFLFVLKKAHVALVGRDTAHRRFAQVATRGQARQYIEEVMPLMLAQRDRHRHRRTGGGESRQ
ncbi:hypothetical protein [Burkholderia alba]|uniref:hypothetical protein n=1 Tax=Burkholderia alba TaxID=2683677 RepID=UPI002B05BA22|nr:hypothetical protein [Burkholderia alba]